MSIFKVLSTFISDAKEVVAKIEAALPKIKSVVDNTISETAPLLALVDPTAARAEEAFGLIFDEIITLLENAAPANPDGSVTLNISADTVTKVKGVIGEAKDWLSSIGVKA